ncbi:MAG: ribD [Crocinitomicaceae bacterium]|jgi:diaminohydroxyphosphoribosylaminopyrimidine deaminase/5-amino-6-(5-phosphoribosylamino)uracil reductase|nr:ribD [Crocinitomicaceae bacterium]
MYDDELYMRRCIELAQLGAGHVAPNPMVGAVIVYQNRVIGEGFHQKYGEAHAEVNAINSVKDSSLLPESTIYVSLEPCAHFGKTPPCADLILEKKIGRVVIGCRDSFEKVDGKGIQKLKANGVEVVVGVLETECRTLNKRFFAFHEKKRPYVILKWAQTQDGFIDRPRTGHAAGINWVSSTETQSLVHHWRSQEPAILVGRKTIENDNPSLTVREVQGQNPLRIIIDSQLQLPAESTIFKDGLKTLVFNRIKHESKENITYYKLEAIDTQHILEALYQLNIQSVFVEGGSRTLQYFLVNHAWDEARIIVGKNKFQDGVKAPVMQGVPRFHEKFSEDEIYYYFRK